MINLILSVVNTVIFIGLIIADIRDIKSNRNLSKQITELKAMLTQSNENEDQFIKTTTNMVVASQNKSTAQDNYLWKSIMILARRIHNLEDNNYVK